MSLSYLMSMLGVTPSELRDCD